MRIWVARPEPGAARTGERLAALGHRPLVAPVLAVRPTGAALPHGPFDGLILTSANALDAVLATTDAGALRGIPVFAVGARTAALAEARLGPVAVGAGDAVALAALVRGRLAAGARLLHLAGAERKAEPAAALTSAGYAIATHVAYAAEAVPHLPDAVFSALAATPPGLDAALHYSRRSARVAHRLSGAAGHGGAFGALRHYCLSDDVAAALDQAGVAAHFVAGRPREDDLLAGLC
ncbi:uroporphyrinogen-III synthase [Methylobacterium sp. WL12]|uniref:uroporphyrinogen-III synthase n=2 Tax=unclassified Methylobacterium TaxID=2615210 RepID=UPI0011CC534E|nr:uroporphyrinogen-III synthase [Methylobacterium sp. WL12]TXM73288.1 uroporphyrinogen-III synthase [Methylobacterium sp. WL12]